MFTRWLVTRRGPGLLRGMACPWLKNRRKRRGSHRKDTAGLGTDAPALAQHGRRSSKMG
jgi:hypothetical protein